MRSDVTSKIAAFDNACDELNPESSNGEYTNSLIRGNGLLNAVLTAITLPDAFTNLRGTPVERRFSAALNQIKALPLARDRVRETYELVRRFQNHFDDELVRLGDQIGHEQALRRLRRRLILTPSEALRREGVCRDFARLLVWALRQVARSSSMSRDAEVFTADMVGGTSDRGLGGHAWVSVSLPLRSANGGIAGFRRVDVDSTWYSNFTPVPYRGLRAPIARMRENHAACQRIVTCLRSGSPRAHGVRAGSSQPGTLLVAPPIGAPVAPRPSRSGSNR